MDVAARIGFRELSSSEIEPAVELLARGMRDNPILIQAFGKDPERRQRRLLRYYAQVVPHIQTKGGFWGAFAGPTLVGVVGTLRPGCCQPRLLDVLRFLPSILTNNTPVSALRIKRWQDAWARHDPHEAHWHVGLVAVDEDMQGRGVGTGLISEHCARMDSLAATSYLETDKAINVRFYQKFGYKIVGQQPVLGVSNWFLQRTANTAARTNIGSPTLGRPALVRGTELRPVG